MEIDAITFDAMYKHIIGKLKLIIGKLKHIIGKLKLIIGKLKHIIGKLKLIIAILIRKKGARNLENVVAKHLPSKSKRE